jgi:hypothetical protein
MAENAYELDKRVGNQHIHIFGVHFIYGPNCFLSSDPKGLAGSIPSRKKVLRISRNGSWGVQLARNAPTLKTVLASIA